MLVAASLLAPSSAFTSLLSSPLNPCGAGVRPAQCTCPSGAQYTPGCVFRYSEYYHCSILARTPGSRLRACGLFSGPPTCRCPSGASFQPSIATLVSRIVAAIG